MSLNFIEDVWVTNDRPLKSLAFYFPATYFFSIYIVGYCNFEYEWSSDGIKICLNLYDASLLQKFDDDNIIQTFEQKLRKRKQLDEYIFTASFDLFHYLQLLITWLLIMIKVFVPCRYFWPGSNSNYEIKLTFTIALFTKG